MLYISLTLSVVLLGTVNLIVAKWRNPVPATIGLGIAFSILPTCLMLVFPAVGWQALVLTLLLFVLLVPNRGRRLYLPISCFATLIIYALLLVPFIENRKETVQLRHEYPYESFEERLPSRPKFESARPNDLDRLSKLEEAIDSEAAERYRNSRTASLRYLHERSVDDFVNSAGFGVGRMGGMMTRPDAESLKHDPREAVAQPDYLNPYIPPAGNLLEPVPAWNAGKMSRFHEDGLVDFLNPKGFGYFKNRREVTGFQSHGMSKAPVAPAPWLVAKIELIGVVIHEKPVAYLSTNLPKMDELRKAPTRPLDAFEMEALEALRKGEDLFARGIADQARMLGAIRATKQCLDCHGASRGDLLGAFSYGFRREEK